MTIFKPIRTHEDLPLPGPITRTAESHSVDFKSTYPLENRAEMAKDIAAFANALGGVILIGTSKDDVPLAYPGIPRNFAEKLSDAFADAHARHLSPKPPLIERVIFVVPNDVKVMLAINVHPFADQIVGARCDTNAWRFPIRVGADTNFLEPAMLPLYATAVRRNIILLGNIDRENDRVRLCFRHPGNQSDTNPAYYMARIHGIMPERNVLVVSTEDETSLESKTHQIPLDDIDRIWDSGVDGWIVRILGHFSDNRRAYHSNPSNTVIRT